MEKKNIKEVITQHRSNNDREERRRKRLEGEFDQASKKRVELENDLEAKERVKEATQKSLDDMYSDVSSLNKAVMKLTQGIQDTREEAKKLEVEYKSANELNKNLEGKRLENNELLHDLKKDILQLKQDNQHFTVITVRPNPCNW